MDVNNLGSYLFKAAIPNYKPHNGWGMRCDDYTAALNSLGNLSFLFACKCK